MKRGRYLEEEGDEVHEGRSSQRDAATEHVEGRHDGRAALELPLPPLRRFRGRHCQRLQDCPSNEEVLLFRPPTLSASNQGSSKRLPAGPRDSGSVADGIRGGSGGDEGIPS